MNDLTAPAAITIDEDGSIRPCPVGCLRPAGTVQQNGFTSCLRVYPFVVVFEKYAGLQ
jgi:hypothetical protein